MIEPLPLPLRPLGSSGLNVPPIGLGTMTFGEQVDEACAHAILERSLAWGVNFLDTAEMYPVPPSAATYARTEICIGNYFARNPGVRSRWVLATKVAGPSRGMPWIREGRPSLRREDIVAACEASLRRLQTDVIDLYQIHWPSRNVPMFGAMYYTPQDDDAVEDEMLEQLRALDTLFKAGKIRAAGLSNETSYGVQTFVNLARQHHLVPIASVQNPYALNSRAYDNGLDETLHRLRVSMLAYSPLAFGVLTGKYDEEGFHGPSRKGRMDLFDRMRGQRWASPGALHAARRYNQLARDHGLTPTQMALAFCYHRWSVASTLVGCTSVEQMEACFQAWHVRLDAEILQAIDTIRNEIRDPAQ